MADPSAPELKDVAELVARYPRAARLVSLIKQVDDAVGGGKGAAASAATTTTTSAELLSALAALATDVLRAPLREVAANGATTPAAASSAALAATANAASAANAAAAAAEAAEAEAAFGRSLAVLEGVMLQAPRSGKADLGFGTDCLRVRSAKGPMLTVAYADIEHIIIMDKIPQQPDDRNGLMLALRRGATIAGAPPPPTSAAAAAAAPPDVLVMQTRTAPLRIRAPEVARHVGEHLEGPVAVIVCQLLGCLLQDVGDDTFLAADATNGFSSARGAAAVSANIKASGGWLFPLKTGLAYLGKPACFLRLGDVADVQYGRAEQGSSTFDLILRVDDGGRVGGGGAGGGGNNSAAAAAAAASSPGRQVELAQIDQTELQKIKGYFADHKADVGALRRQRAQQAGGAGGGGVWGSAVAPKAAAAMAGGGGGGVAAAQHDDDDDESDEDDEDFKPEGSSGEGEEEEGGGKMAVQKRGKRAARGDGDGAGPSAGAKRPRSGIVDADAKEEEEVKDEEEEDDDEDEDEDEEDIGSDDSSDDEDDDEDEDESLVPSDELSE